MVTVTKERILSLLAEALLAVMAQEMRPCLRCRLYRLTPIIDERMRVLSLSTESLIRRLWNEMAILKFGLVQAKATLARKVHLSPPLLEFYFKYRQVKRAGAPSGSLARGVQPEQLPGISGPDPFQEIFWRIKNLRSPACKLAGKYVFEILKRPVSPPSLRTGALYTPFFGGSSFQKTDYAGCSCRV
jgi:hypothetical protein